MLVAIYRAAEILHKTKAHMSINGLISIALVQEFLSSYPLKPNYAPKAMSTHRRPTFILSRAFHLREMMPSLEEEHSNKYHWLPLTVKSVKHCFLNPLSNLRYYLCDVLLNHERHATRRSPGTPLRTSA
jgi:hypothetical protein